MNTFSLQTRLYSGPGSLKVLSRFSHKHIWICLLYTSDAADEL
ncbi:hypothetical protein ACX3VG_14505, partial [Escherichia coli]